MVSVIYFRKPKEREKMKLWYRKLFSCSWVLMTPAIAQGLLLARFFALHALSILRCGWRTVRVHPSSSSEPFPSIFTYMPPSPVESDTFVQIKAQVTISAQIPHLKS